MNFKSVRQLINKTIVKNTDRKAPWSGRYAYDSNKTKSLGSAAILVQFLVDGNQIPSVVANTIISKMNLKKQLIQDRINKMEFYGQVSNGQVKVTTDSQGIIKHVVLPKSLKNISIEKQKEFVRSAVGDAISIAREMMYEEQEKINDEALDSVYEALEAFNNNRYLDGRSKDSENMNNRGGILPLINIGGNYKFSRYHLYGSKDMNEDDDNWVFEQKISMQNNLSINDLIKRYQVELHERSLDEEKTTRGKDDIAFVDIDDEECDILEQYIERAVQRTTRLDGYMNENTLDEAKESKDVESELTEEEKLKQLRETEESLSYLVDSMKELKNGNFYNLLYDPNAPDSMKNTSMYEIEMDDYKEKFKLKKKLGLFSKRKD